MKIVLNSDILFTNWRLRTGLPAPLKQFAVECAKTGGIIVLSETTLLEVERNQSRLIQEEIQSLEKAYRTLRGLDIAFDEKDPAGLFELPDLAQLFRATGAEVQLEEPVLEDFRDAHRRACLHLSPHPPEGDSDEMRDLVIWAMAMRLAKDDQVILLSRDKVHTHDRGNEEAALAGVMRARDIDEALELLGVENPATELVRQMLEPIWTDLRGDQLPLPERFKLRGVEEAVFVRGQTGIDEAMFRFRTVTDDEHLLEAAVQIKREGADLTSLAFSEISLDGKPFGSGKFDFLINKALPVLPSDMDEPLAELRDIIGEQS